MITLRRDRMEEARNKLAAHKFTYYQTKGLEPPWKQQVSEHFNELTDFIFDLIEYTKVLEQVIRVLQQDD